jgi:acetyl-CoA synthetase
VPTSWKRCVHAQDTQRDSRPAGAKWRSKFAGEWYLTGDLARRAAKGQLWFQGRDDDVIVTSGYNVGPAEVEAVVQDHRCVREVAVLDAPDAARGSVVRAVIVADPEADIDQLRSEIKELVNSRLGHHAYPRIIDVVKQLPRNHAGKVLRTALREQSEHA